MKRQLIKIAGLFMPVCLVLSCTKSPEAVKSTDAEVIHAAKRTNAAIVHPGMLHTSADLARMKSKVLANAQPWKSGWDRLIANSHSFPTYTPNPQAVVIRGGTGQNYQTLYNDAHAAYQNALRWKIQGVAVHGDKARDILNAWSNTLTEISGNADRWLAAGIYGYQMANAGELMKGYPGFDEAKFKTMLLNVFYTKNHQFLVDHNGACITNYWANWDLCTVASVLAIGIFCDDQAKIDEAVNYFKTGAGNGSILHAVPFLHPNNLGQWQEMGRDQGHSTLGIGLMGVICEMAWNQGIDLYGYSNSRFRMGAEYVARYNRGQSVPFTTYNWGNGVNCAPMSHTAPSDVSRGNNRPIWQMIIGHYTGRLGQSVPEMTAFAQTLGVEGGGGDYGTTSGGFDQLGFGTLTFTR